MCTHKKEKIRLTNVFTIYARLLSASRCHLYPRNSLYQMPFGVISILHYLCRKVPEMLISNAVTQVPSTPSVFMLHHKNTLKSNYMSEKILVNFCDVLLRPHVPCSLWQGNHIRLPESRTLQKNECHHHVLKI